MLRLFPKPTHWHSYRLKIIHCFEVKDVRLRCVILKNHGGTAFSPDVFILIRVFIEGEKEVLEKVDKKDIDTLNFKKSNKEKVTLFKTTV